MLDRRQSLIYGRESCEKDLSAAAGFSQRDFLPLALLVSSAVRAARARFRLTGSQPGLMSPF